MIKNYLINLYKYIFGIQNEENKEEEIIDIYILFQDDKAEEIKEENK